MLNRSSTMLKLQRAPVEPKMRVKSLLGPKKPRVTPKQTDDTLSNVRAHVDSHQFAREFLVPRDALCASSEDFRTSLQKGKDGVTILNLQRDDSFVFGVFVDFIVGENAGHLVRHLGCSGFVDCAVCRQTECADWGEAALVEMYLFANRHSIVAFKVEILSTLLEYYARSCTLPSARAMGVVKRNSRNKYDDCYLLMMARWVYAFYPQGGNGSQAGEDVLQLPEPFQVDIQKWGRYFHGLDLEDAEPKLQPAVSKMAGFFCEIWELWSEWLEDLTVVDCGHRVILGHIR